MHPSQSTDDDDSSSDHMLMVDEEVDDENSTPNDQSAAEVQQPEGDKTKSAASFVRQEGNGFICTGCHKKFKVFKVAQAHQKHPVQCEFCRKTLCNTIVLGKHMWKQHPFNETGETFKCTMCEQKFLSKEACDRHEYDHVVTNNTTDFTYCEICDINIGNKAVYTRHIQKHQKEVYKCTICYKGFISAHLLENHIARHCDTILAHECRICSKKINSALYFRYHMNKHTGEKPYRCDTCHESYVMPCMKHRKRKRRSTVDE